MTEKVLEKLRENNVKVVKLQFTDIHGHLKEVDLPNLAQVKESLDHGTWFDGSSIQGFTRISESDQYLKPDVETLKVLPWDPETARIICDVHNPDETPFEGDARGILKKVCKEAEDLGFTYNVGPELEFFLFKRGDNGLEPIASDTAGYFDHSSRDLGIQVRKEIYSSLDELDIHVEMGHHEVAPGQHEIDFRYDDAVKTADNALTLKHVVKNIADKHGLYASFMPKPLMGENGNGMHVHQSFSKDDKNVFYDGNDERNLSDIAKHFIEGQLRHARAFCAVTNPTVNSYKRLVPGYEAPVYPCWGQKNRSAMIRIPRTSKGREEKATRAELRCPDPSSNPYLAFAVMLAAGLDGVRGKLQLRSATETSLYEMSEKEIKDQGIEALPASLGEAIEELEKDEVILNALGPHAGPAYVRAKKEEFAEYRLQVTPWELEKYLPRL